MNWPTYAALPGVSWSSLLHLDDSPKHYRYAQDNPRADTLSLTVGNYVHTSVLRPDEVATEYAVWPKRRAGKAYKAFVADNPGKTILSLAEVDNADQIAAAVLADPEARALLSSGVAEQPVRWTDPTTGIACKSRTDWIDPKRRLLVDLKTTRSTDVRRFGHDVARYKYHGQLAFYAAGLALGAGWTPERHVLIAVENTAPYDVAVFDLDADTLQVGRELADLLLARLKECQASGVWPGRHPKPVTLGPANLPPWIFGGGIPEIAFLEDP